MEKEEILKSNIISEDSETKKNIIRIIKGSVFSIILSLILLLIFAVLLTYTDISESTIVPVVTIIVGVSILLGSTISTIKIKKNGILNGGLVGLIYTIALYILSSIVLTNFSFNINSLIMIATSVIAGMIGGIIGVNLNHK